MYLVLFNNETERAEYFKKAKHKRKGKIALKAQAASKSSKEEVTGHC